MRVGEVHSSKLALVLSGGGARGAYQVGVLQGLMELGVFQGPHSPFQILVGTSAGSINTALLAAYSDDLSRGIWELSQVWSRVKAKMVFRTDLLSLARIATRWIRDLSFGGLLGHVSPKALLDTSPLRTLLADIPFGRIESHIGAGILDSLAIAATDYHTSNGVVFIQGGPETPLWDRVRYTTERARIGVDHLMASSAIPFFFPTIELQGRHLGDGCIRNMAPLGPAIHLGADRIVAIGVQEARQGRNLAFPRPAPTVAEVAGVLLDAVMLDAIEVDVDHSGRVNASVAAGGHLSEGPFRWVDVLWLCPSQQFGPLAASMFDHIPALVRYLLRGLGGDEANAELASYLLFDAAFCSRLMELGRSDVRAQADRVRNFFHSPSQVSPSPSPGKN